MASITDKLRLTRKTGGRPVSTYLTAVKGIGASSLSANSLDYWPDTSDTAVDFVLYRKDTNNAQVAGTLTTWKGICSGTTISSLTLVSGTDQEYPGDDNSVLVATPTAAWSTDFMNVLIGLIDQDGTLKAGAVDNAAALADNIVTTSKILDANVTNAKLAAGTTRLGSIKKTTTADVLTTSYVTWGTVTATSTGRECEVYVSYHATNANSGGNRSMYGKVQCDGVDISPTDLILNVPNLGADEITGSFFTFTYSSTPTAGSHTWTFQARAATGSSVKLNQGILTVKEIA